MLNSWSREGAESICSLEATGDQLSTSYLTASQGMADVNNQGPDPPETVGDGDSSQNGENGERRQESRDLNGGPLEGAMGVEGELPMLSKVGNIRLARVLVAARWHKTSGTELYTVEMGHACIKAFGLDPIVATVMPLH